MTAYRDRLEAGYYQAKKPKKETASVSEAKASKSTAKKPAAKKG